MPEFKILPVKHQKIAGGCIVFPLIIGVNLLETTVQVVVKIFSGFFTGVLFKFSCQFKHARVISEFLYLVTDGRVYVILSAFKFIEKSLYLESLLLNGGLVVFEYEIAGDEGHGKHWHERREQNRKNQFALNRSGNGGGPI